MIFFSVSFPISAKIAIFLCLTSRGYRSFCSSRRQSAKKHNCDSLLFPGQYDGIGYWQNLKNRSGTKNPDRNLPDFFNRQMAFNPLHLNHLQQVRCYCWCKVKNSESKSQRKGNCRRKHESCYCWCKVKNSESKSQLNEPCLVNSVCCYCWCKVKNSESKSQPNDVNPFNVDCCYCWCKVKNSESKSQLIHVVFFLLSGCYCWCKVKNSESKSQH